MDYIDAQIKLDEVSKRLEKLDDAAVDHMRLLTAAAGAGLLFSLGFVANATTYDWVARCLLNLGWLGLGVSAFSGLSAKLSFASLGNATLTDYQVRAEHVQKQMEFQQNMFIASATLIASAIGYIMQTADVPLAHLAVSDAAKAVVVARNVVPKGDVIRKLNHVDLVKGIDPNSGPAMAWSVEFEVDATSEARLHNGIPQRRTRDIIVTAEGHPSVIETQ